MSRAVLEAQGSVMTNKYAEGYPGKRYYGGCQYVDEVETFAIERAKSLFQSAYANVQPHSGSSANQAILLGLLKPYDTILGMDLSAGGHLSHGFKVNLSGKWFQSFSYGVVKETGLIDYDQVRSLAKTHRPKLIICGASAYSQVIDFEAFSTISREVGAYLLADIAHYAGLIATNYYPSPLPWADIVTSTTHKTLRGPRGGFILSNNQEVMKKINAALFPGLQGGPLMHIIAAKAVCFQEAASEAFKTYAQEVIKSAQCLSETLAQRGYDTVSGGTVCHLLLLDLQPHHLTGKEAENALWKAHLTCNKNAIPFDPHPPQIASGIRLGTAASVSRGLTAQDFKTIGLLIADILDSLKTKEFEKNLAQFSKTASNLCRAYPVYPD